VRIADSARRTFDIVERPQRFALGVERFRVAIIADHDLPNAITAVV
jgi:hypothetical protein